MTPHAVFEELAAGQALDALEPEDEQLFLQHMSGCSRCERDLARHLDTAAELAYGAGPTHMPESVFAGIRAAVVAESGEAAFAAPDASAPVRLDDVRRRRRRNRGAALVAAAAGLVLVAGLVGSNVTLRQERQQQQSRSDHVAQALETVRDGPSRNVPLLDDKRGVAAVAVLHSDTVSLVVDGLAPNEGEDTVYVLWEQGRYGGVRAIGTFDVRPDQVEVLRDLPLTKPATEVVAFAVTREAGDVAPARPMQAPLASGSVETA